MKNGAQKDLKNQNNNNANTNNDIQPTDSAAKNIAAQTFTFRELASATKNFRQEYLLGEGGFGRVYKGKLEKTGQVLILLIFEYRI